VGRSGIAVPQKPLRLPATLAALLLGGLLAACNGEAPPEEAKQDPQQQEAPEPPAERPALLLEPVDFAALPGWAADDVSAALPALTRSCGRLAKQPDDRPLGPDSLAGTVADWRAPCAAIQGVAAGDDAALRGVLEAQFRPFAVSNAGKREGLFTGYYEAELKAAEAPTAPGATPLYRLPDDLVTVDLALFRADLRGEKLVGRVEAGRLVPYLTRQQIDAGALAGRGLELVGFAGSNGHPFYAIGRALIEEGIVSRQDSSMQSIRDWLRANPEKAAEMMQRNARYIFFREIDGDGPIGAQGVALIPGRSLAVDSALLPLGVPLYLDTTWPATDKPLRRLMVAQDVGSAIKGAVRGDFFWGSGEEALAQAGRMKQTGVYYLLLPRTVAERRERAS